MIVSKSNNCPHCGDGHFNQCYIVYTNGDYCFSCHKGTSTDREGYNFKPRSKTNDIYIPNEATYNINEFSTNILQWLAQYGVYKELIRFYGIMYVPYTEFTTKTGNYFVGESLIFPVLSNDHQIKMYQRRFFPEKKILTVGNAQSMLIAASEEANSNFQSSICIVEDYISAIKVGEVYPTLCLFGTNLKYSYKNILKDYHNIYIWLDGDYPGQTAANKIYMDLCDTIKYRAKLNAFDSRNYTVQNIATEKDPKCYTKTEILTYLMDSKHANLSKNL